MCCNTFAPAIKFNKFAESEAVREADYDFEQHSYEEYDVSALIGWLLPCNTNGFLAHFKVDVHGESLEDDEEDDVDSETVVPANDPIANETYTYVIERLKPSYNYSVYLTPYVTNEEDGTSIEGTSTVLNFKSPDGGNEI